MFDPKTFFEHTAHFASQGRGDFRLLRLPRVFQTRGSLVDEAWEMLSTGIIAKSASIPGQSLGTHEQTFMGPTMKIPYGIMFSDLEIEFLLMGRSMFHAQSLRSFFTQWQELIGGYVPPTGLVARNPIQNYSLFATEYMENYVTEAMVTVFSPSTEDGVTRVPILQTQYIDLYPASLGPIQTSWDSPDAPLSLSVTFAYFYSRDMMTRL